MNITISPKRDLSGEITAPPSKARTHRTLVSGLLSEGVTRIVNPLSCDDTEATLNAVAALGAKSERAADSWVVRGSGRPLLTSTKIPCGESAATLRFMIPVASLTGSEVAFTAKESLLRRPLDPLTKALRQIGVSLSMRQGGIDIAGHPVGGKVQITGSVSSQFISGLLFAGPLMSQGLIVEVTSPLESRSYVLLTMEIMKHHGIEIRANNELSRFEIATSQKYKAANHKVSGDYSSAAFMLTAAAITDSKMLVRDLPQTENEPDAAIVKIMSEMGARSSHSEEGVIVEGAELEGADIDLRDNPDLGPILAVLACYAKGKTRIYGAGRLRYKESDRLAIISHELASMGADIKETEDGLAVHGPSQLKGRTVSSHGDHRIAMALTVAALGASGRVVIRGTECVSKSYPRFFDDLRSLGVEIVG